MYIIKESKLYQSLLLHPPFHFVDKQRHDAKLLRSYEKKLEFAQFLLSCFVYAIFTVNFALELKFGKKLKNNIEKNRKRIVPLGHEKFLPS